MTQEIKLITQPDTSLIEKYDRLELECVADFVTIDWNMGNTCNYSCSYCDTWIHDGTVPWTPLET